jgi:hypothetical protein
VWALELREQLSGAYTLEPGGIVEPMVLDLCWQLTPRALREGGAVSLTGEARAPQLATRRPLQGRLTMPRLGTLAYVLSLVADDDSRLGRLVLAGKRDLGLLGFPPPFTVLELSISAARGPIGRATLRFDVRSDLGALVRSISLVSAGAMR